VPPLQAGFRCPTVGCRPFHYAIAGCCFLSCPIAGSYVFHCESVPSLTTLPQVLKSLTGTLSDAFDPLLRALPQALDSLLGSLA